MTDKFPEAFERFSKDVLVKDITSWRQMEIAFSHWAGRKWVPTRKQSNALAKEARKLGIETTGYRTREEQIRTILKPKPTIGQTTQQMREEKRENSFSKSYVSFNSWMEKTTRTTAYQRRIINYIRTHPNATLEQARGHRAKRS
jgi:hypothetical protein